MSEEEELKPFFDFYVNGIRAFRVGEDTLAHMALIIDSMQHSDIDLMGYKSLIVKRVHLTDIQDGLKGEKEKNDEDKTEGNWELLH